MQALHELQIDFQNFLQGKDDHSIEKKIVGKNPQEVKRRLMIYREAYQLRLLENLSKQYPVLLRALGETAFNQLGLSYIHAHPPTSFAIRIFGEHLSVFLRTQKDQPDYLAELAEFEWAMDDALDNSSLQPVFTMEDLQQLGEEGLLTTQFRFQDSLKFLSFTYEIPKLWKYIREHHKLPASIYPSGAHVGVWRYNWQAFYLTISDVNLRLVRAAQAGKKFTELCELAIHNNNEERAAALTAEVVFAWINNHWLAK